MKPTRSFWSGLTMMVALLPLSACGDDEATSQIEPVRPVLFQIVESVPERHADFAGAIEPRYSTELAFRVLGRIISRPVDVGDLVKKGDTVALLDASALELAVQSAKAQLASAEAQYANAAASEKRQRKLLEGKNISQARYEEARQARESARANLQKAQAGLRKAKDQSSYAVLSSEYDGVVSSTSAEVGQIVAAGQPVVTIARPDIREAVVDIPDSLIEYLVVGTLFNVTLQADPSVSGQGKVREVAPQADAQTRTRRIRIALDNPPEDFRLGATITATLDVAERQYFLLPMTALLERDGKTAIWVIDPQTQKVSLKEIEVIERRGNSFVAGDVNVGIYVVTAGVNSLKEGQKVRLDAKGIAQ